MSNLQPREVLPNIKKKLAKECELSRFWMCRVAEDKIYDVYNITQTGGKYTVNLQTHVCSCRRCMLSGIPCCHVVTSIRDRLEDPESYIPSIFRKEAYVQCYEPMIYHTYGQNQWEATNWLDILPPPIKKMPGSPKKSRNKDADEKCRDSTLVSRKGKSNRCGICKQPGHKKATCKQKNGTSFATQTGTAATRTETGIASATPSTTTQTGTASATPFATQTGTTAIRTQTGTACGTTSATTTQTGTATTQTAFASRTGTAAKTTIGTAAKTRNGARSKSNIVATSKPPKPTNQAPVTSALVNGVGTSTIGTRLKMQIRKPTS
ncbi:hypothetical protein QL285_003420 [Trifolium repens]|nr:hypothetical protein QL285_003420 [Trifolium repens]